MDTKEAARRIDWAQKIVESNAERMDKMLLELMEYCPEVKEKRAFNELTIEVNNIRCAAYELEIIRKLIYAGEIYEHKKPPDAGTSDGRKGKGLPDEYPSLF